VLNGIAGLITAIAALIGAVSTPFCVIYMVNRTGKRERPAAAQAGIDLAAPVPPAVAITEAIIEASDPHD
jgi:hypothetical protein